MASIDFQQVERFADLFSDGEVPKFPQHRDDLDALNATQRAVLQERMPELWQSLHGGNEANLPADVLLRMHKNQLRKGDEVHLKAAGLQAAAIALEADIRQGEIEASFKRMAEESEARAVANEQQRAAAEMKRLESMQLGQMQMKASQGSF